MTKMGRKKSKQRNRNNDKGLVSPAVDGARVSCVRWLLVCVLFDAGGNLARGQPVTGQPIREVFSEGEGLELRYQVRNVSIEGQGNVLVTDRGGTYRVAMEIFHDCRFCGNAVNQVIVGLASEKQAQVSVWTGKQRSGGPLKIVNPGTSKAVYTQDNPGPAEWVRVEFSLEVPDEAGEYYIRTRYAQAYTGNLMTADARAVQKRFYEEPLGWWRVDRPKGPDANSNIGAVVVRKR